MDLIQAAEKLRTIAVDCGGDMSREGLAHLMSEVTGPTEVIAQHQWHAFGGDIRELKDGSNYWVMTRSLAGPIFARYVSPSSDMLGFDGRRRVRIGFDQITHFALAVVPEPPVSERAAAIERLRTAVGGSIALQADIDTILGDVA